MMMRKLAVRILVLALPICASASAATGIFDSAPDDQADGAKTSASVPSTWSEPATTVVEVTIPPSTPGAPAAERPLSTNPLWGMPLKQFTVTRERPIFLPSRRPPAPPPSAVTVAKVVAPPKPKEPEQPQLSLVGTISGDDARFGIFVDQATKAVLRLKEGEDFQGWQLRSIQSREASFQKNQQTFVVALPQPGLSQPSIAVRSEAWSPNSETGSVVPVNTRQRRDR
jgi:general secretion pathway protein N